MNEIPLFKDESGEKNSSLNAVLQILFQNMSFADNLDKLKKYVHYGCNKERCLYCALQNLLLKYRNAR